jgi:hypothetical protein
MLEPVLDGGQAEARRVEAGAEGGAHGVRPLEELVGETGAL